MAREKQATQKLDLRINEGIFIGAGLLILASVLIIFLSGSFVVWTIAKILYGAGVLLALLNK